MMYFLFALLSLASAHDYELISFEASDYRSWTSEEMRERLSDHAPLLPDYGCGSHDGSDAFWEPPHMSPSEDQLRVRAQSGDEFVYRRGGLYALDGTPVRHTSDRFLSLALASLSELEGLPSGARLLRSLERSPFPLVLRLGNFSFNPTVPGGRMWSGIKNAQAVLFLTTRRMSDGGVVFNRLGSGGEVLWHPTKEILSIESDGEKRATPRTVSLAHELFHAWDSVRGLLDMRMVKSESYRFETVVEYRGVWFENQIRRELGHRYRLHYSEPDFAGQPDLLDESGEPIYIPSGCL